MTDASRFIHPRDGHHATFELEEVSLEERFQWYSGFASSGPHRLFVAERDSQILGYATSSAFHPMLIYARSVELGTYVHPDSCRSGVGTRLYESLLDSLAAEPTVERLVAGIKLPNEASIGLHLKFGFERVGTFRGAGERDGRPFDLCWFDRPARLAA